jgi:NitT/TauT family transport system substrate-binding protein
MRVPVVAVVAAAALLSAGCAGKSGSSSAPSAPPEKPNLTVAAVPAADSAGLYIAQQRGLFAAQGLHVKIVKAISGGTVLAGQMAGKYDVTLGNYVSYILADALSHDKLHVLAAASVMQPNNQVLMVPQNSPIRTVSQLKGKTIGVNILNNIGTLLLSSVLNDNAMQASEVHFKPIEFPDMAKALQSHEVNAAWMPEPFVTFAEESVGAQPLADTDQGTTQNFPIAGYMVTQAWMHKYPRTAAAFIRAVRQGQEIASTSIPAVQRGLAGYAGVPKAAAAIVTPPTFPLTTDPRSIQRIANLMLQFGMLHHAFDASQMLGS